MLEELKQQNCRVDTELETLRSLAVQLGLEGVHPDLSTVVKIIEKALQDKIALQLKAEAPGHDSVDLALEPYANPKVLAMFHQISRFHRVSGLFRALPTTLMAMTRNVLRRPHP